MLPNSQNCHRAFTLGEFLISLSILGIIATFTIPKILGTQQDSSYQNITKETLSTIAAAFDLYKKEGKLTASTKVGDITPYMNYLTVDTTSLIDDRPPSLVTSLDCSSNVRGCLKLHNGSVLTWDPDVNFGGTNTTNAIWYKLDPNGSYDGVASGRAINIWLYYNGRVTTFCCIDPNTVYYNNSTPNTRTPTADPIWFNWNG